MLAHVLQRFEQFEENSSTFVRQSTIRLARVAIELRLSRYICRCATLGDVPGNDVANGYLILENLFQRTSHA